jgi:hypothetical protein
MSGCRPPARSPWFADGKTSATTEESAANAAGKVVPELAAGADRDFELDELKLELDLERDIR